MDQSRPIAALAALAALLLAGFFAFVGWSKATLPLVDLARFHAWTVYVPERLGRAVGVSEVVLAIGLLAFLARPWRQVARWCALLLIANQIVAATIHTIHREYGALPQNAMLMALLAFVARRARDIDR